MKLYWRYLDLADERKIAKPPNLNHRQINCVYGISHKNQDMHMQSNHGTRHMQLHITLYYCNVITIVIENLVVKD